MSLLFKLYKIFRPKKAHGKLSKLLLRLDNVIISQTIEMLLDYVTGVNRVDNRLPLDKFTYVKNCFLDCINIVGYHELRYQNIKNEEYEFRTNSSLTCNHMLLSGVSMDLEHQLRKYETRDLILKPMQVLDWVSNASSVTDIITSSLYIITTLERFNTTTVGEVINGSELRESDEVNATLSYGNSREFLILLNDLILTMVIYLKARN